VATTTVLASTAASGPKGVGLDMADLDRTASPCDDFYEFSGGNWLKANAIPSYATSWGPRNLLGLRTQATLKQILEEAATNRSAAPGSNTQKVGDFYAAAMDTVAIEKAGISLLKLELACIARLKTRAELPTLIAHEQDLGTGAFFRATRRSMKNKAHATWWACTRVASLWATATIISKTTPARIKYARLAGSICAKYLACWAIVRPWPNATLPPSSASKSAWPRLRAPV
jgi:predicted metalloendopeptidase